MIRKPIEKYIFLLEGWIWGLKTTCKPTDQKRPMALCIFSFQFVYFVPSEVPRSLVHVFFPINAYNLLFLFVQIFRAFGSIDIIVEPKMITLEWIASPCNDMFADAVLSAVLQVKTFLMVIKIFVSILRMLLRILIFENYICSFFL